MVRRRKIEYTGSTDEIFHMFDGVPDLFPVVAGLPYSSGEDHQGVICMASEGADVLIVFCLIGLSLLSGA